MYKMVDLALYIGWLGIELTVLMEAIQLCCYLIIPLVGA